MSYIPVGTLDKEEEKKHTGHFSHEHYAENRNG